MRLESGRTLLLCVLMAPALVAGDGQTVWESADRATKRLAPSAFVDLPAAIRKELGRRGCTIPQPFGATRRRNAIKGHFTSARQVDWAILCSVRRTSTILVFRHGSPSDVAEIAALLDSTFLQQLSEGTIGYSRALSVANTEFIRVQFERHGGPTPPPLDHDGIDDAFVEKGSSVWYWDGGRWLQLTGAD